MVAENGPKKVDAKLDLRSSISTLWQPGTRYDQTEMFLEHFGECDDLLPKGTYES